MSESILKQFRRKHMPKEIQEITSLKELEERYDNCPERFKPAIKARHGELLKSVTSLKELEEWYRSCPTGLEPAIEARYGELLKSVTSLKELGEQHSECPTGLKYLFLQSG